MYRQDYVLDSKLAEYVFFPLSHVFRENKALPVRATEIALQCLQILISRGWRELIPPDLAKQLLVLLTFLAGGSASEVKSQEVNEELATSAFACLRYLFGVSGTAGLSRNGSVDAADFPILGHAVSVILGGITDGPSIKVRLGALNALDSTIGSITDNEALTKFFPGIVSALTKVLSAGSRSKGSYKILQGALNTLNKILLKVINDDKAFKCEQSEPGNNPAVLGPHGRKEGEKEPWLQATSAQVKLALANILPLQSHEKEEVRGALFQLCISIMERCRRSLSQSVPMMIETSVVICAQGSIVDAVELLDNLKIVLGTDAILLEALKSSAHDWIIALPRALQSIDETPKARIVDQITITFEILDPQSTVSEVLGHALTSNLRLSISAAIRNFSSQAIQDVPESHQELSQALRTNLVKGGTKGFPEVVFRNTSQRSTIEGLQSLLERVCNTSILANLEMDVMETLSTTSGEEQLASLWLAIRMQSERRAAPRGDVQRATEGFEQSSSNLDDLYAFCLTILSETVYSAEADWRLQALSLEAIALQAQRQRYDFRSELVDALYPILERLGSSNAATQKHAIVTLRNVSAACDYATPKDMVIENVDYLVNAVSLKLNTLDISPQAPQVLTMMVRLCGATLLPYLDDLIEAIFAILECYHGYPLLVEQMFGVLNALVEEGGKGSATAMPGAAEPVSYISTYKPTSVADLASQLKKARTENPPLDRLSSTPLDVASGSSSPNDSMNALLQPKFEEATSLPKQLLTISSITSLTQHHLPTSSPSLRLLLLNLLPHAFQLLYYYQDHFLPLVNALWPVLIVRLYDDELYVTIAAANAVIALCKAAGGFLATRVMDEWAQILGLYRRCEREAGLERTKMKRAGLAGRRWEALGRLVAGIVKWVGASTEMEEEVWEMASKDQEAGRGFCLGGGMELKETLEALNADAMWLTEERARVRQGGGILVKPAVEGVVFREVQM